MNIFRKVRYLFEGIGYFFKKDVPISIQKSMVWHLMKTATDIFVIFTACCSSFPTNTFLNH